MYRFATLALFAAFGFGPSAFGQSNPFELKPPAEADAALRARVKEFFDLQVKGTPRKAEVLVAEDSKDMYYSDPKPKFFNCELSRIDYTDQFTKAKVLMVCERNVMIPGAPTLTAKVPTPSNWRIEDGLWMYYLDPQTMYPSPFGGYMKPGPEAPAKAAPVAPPIPSIESLTKAVMEQVKVDKAVLTMKAGDKAEVNISNSAPGPMKVLLPGNLNGMEARLENPVIAAGGKTVLHLVCGKTAISHTFSLEVAETGQPLPIQILVQQEKPKEKDKK